MGVITENEEFDKCALSFAMAQRLKYLRKSKKLSHASLCKQLKERYGVSISRDMLIQYEVTSEQHKKKFANNGMRVEMLRILADFYGVSADFILGSADKSIQRQANKDEQNGKGDESVKKEKFSELERDLDFAKYNFDGLIALIGYRSNSMMFNNKNRAIAMADTVISAMNNLKNAVVTDDWRA